MVNDDTAAAIYFLPFNELELYFFFLLFFFFFFCLSFVKEPGTDLIIGIITIIINANNATVIQFIFKMKPIET